MNDIDRLIEEALADTDFVNLKEQREILKNHLRESQAKRIVAVANIRMLGDGKEASDLLKRQYDDLRILTDGMKRLRRDYDAIDRRIEAEDKKAADEEARAEAKASKNGASKEAIPA